MNKELALHTMMLLSAMESWMFSTDKVIPDHILVEVDHIQALLKEIVLKDDK